MRVSGAGQMEELIASATAFLQAMRDDQHEGSLAWVERQLKALSEEATRGRPEAGAREALKKLHERLRCGSGAKDGGAGASAGASAGGHAYWLGQRPLPGLTEEEVDRAVQQLSEEERRQLAEEFAALREEGFELLREDEADPAHAEELVAGQNAEGPDRDDEQRTDGDHSAMDPDKSDGRSMFFGGTLLELTYDDDAWPLSARREACAMTMNHHGMGQAPLPRFCTPSTDSRDAVSAAPNSVVSRALSSCAKPSYEMEQAGYIRDRVRMMLLANRVAKDVEGDIIDAALGATEELRRERERRLQSLLERQAELLQKAVEVMQLLQTLHRRAIGEYVRNPYVMQTWQRNESAQVCQKCQRPFNLFVMRHHCRRCGLIFCQRCSSYAGMLPDRRAEQHVASAWLRLCQDCYEICCEYQKCVSTASPPPRGRCERESRAPETPSSILFSKYSDENGVLADKLPPFYVVLPEEWYTARAATASGWLNSIRNVPYLLCENLHDGISSLTQMATPGLERLLSVTTDTVRRIKEEK
ncbi:putative zinc finger protein [Trypanosoma conorhini]|uniref:Putative zinc finger protein n=1 Tax=Trypanosoma conorhini TaxID=83891 RepID=A0A422Q709_9TRYP|nr:putative zinc finger protein [Trypanosoma conorhini]RNF25738.1 putative zinc finger protein [Trypanosoma conorhini]